MPLRRGSRLLKRWRYVGYYAPELMLCVGDASIGPLRRRWWAIALPGGRLHERSSLASAGVRLEGARVRVASGDVRIELDLNESDGVEVASPAGEGYVWTRKQGDARARGSVRVEGSQRRIDGIAFVDESAGYHPRHTAWKWSAGVGRAEDGRRLAWNLVSGLHDSPRDSERTLWIEGRPEEAGPVEFAADLSRVEFAEGGGLAFREWSAREERVNLLLLRSTYRQPFGSFEGELPGGLRLAEGYGVMEEHDVHW